MQAIDLCDLVTVEEVPVDSGPKVAHILGPQDFEYGQEDLAYKANTNLCVKVLSDGFSAETVMDIDVRDLAEFAARLSALYETLKGSAHLKEPYGAHNSIAFFSKTGGHIAVRGRIHHQNANGDAQELTFENEIDQTFLRAFARKLFADFGGKTDHASTR